jgi:hypothetical protein
MDPPAARGSTHAIPLYDDAGQVYEVQLTHRPLAAISPSAISGPPQVSRSAAVAEPYTQDVAGLAVNRDNRGQARHAGQLPVNRVVVAELEPQPPIPLRHTRAISRRPAECAQTVGAPQRPASSAAIIA